MQNIGIYVHWPYCLSKCPYCDFNSHVSKEKIDQLNYLSLIKKELDSYSEIIENKTISSVFFGGGTPSLMEPKIIDNLLDHISKKYKTDQALEITLEANPTSVEQNKFIAYSSAGINRVSIGVQSLNDVDLKRLGRNHTAKEAIKAIDIAFKSFNSVSIDLIYCRPGQKEEDWERELHKALSLSTQHLSLYQLTIEPNTRYEILFKAGKLKLPDENTSAKLYQMTEDICEKFNLNKYEISNFAKNGHQCLHNLNYWHSGEWIGIGPGAHSRIIKNMKRTSIINEYDPKKWSDLIIKNGNSAIEEEILTNEQNSDEYLLMSLRTTQGMKIKKYNSLGGKLDKVKVDQFINDGFLEKNNYGENINITRKGSMLSDMIITNIAS
jgi:putative oxygen-independent coproporphyrinogen III oxidase